MTAEGLHIETRPLIEGPTVRDAVMQLLAELEMTTIFGNPGSTELPMFRDLSQQFRYILGLQESVVVGMADGFAQATGRAALVNLHSSAGVGHAMGNIFTAYRNKTPLVITAGQQARSILPYEPFLFAERATEMPRPFVKWAVEPARAQDVPLAIARAWHIAMQPPFGPTFVSIPIDDWDAPCQPITHARKSGRTGADPEIIGEIADTLSSGTKLAIVAGAGVAHDGARAALKQLAEALSADVWIAPMAARNPFPEDHGLFKGFLPASREAIVQRLNGADRVLVLGAPAFTYHVEGHGPFIPEGAQLIQISSDPSDASRVPEGLAVVGNLRLTLEAVLAQLPERAPAPLAAPTPRPAPDASSLTDALLIHRLHALRPKGIAIVEEAPSTRGPLHDYFPICDGDEFHTCASGGLGHSMPAAVGVALGRPDRKTLCIMGDGSAMYAIQSLWSAAHHQADVRFVIVNNGGYAALDQFGAMFGIEVVGSKLPGIDFVGIAQAQGVPAERVSDPADLDSAIMRLFEGAGPCLLEVMVSRN